jgi:hypothetical protein
MNSGAGLMRRILHEGISFADDPEGTGRMLVGHVQKKLGRATAIVDDREPPGVGTSVDYTRLASIVPPFAECWTEGRIHDGGRWGVYTTHYPDLSRLSVIGVCSSPRFGPTLMGQLSPFLTTSGELEMTDRCPCWTPPTNPAGTLLTAFFWHAFDLFNLLNCKNISLQKHEHDRVTAKRLLKRDGVAAAHYRYHTLVVRKGFSDSDGPGQKTETMPLHVCRGHYRTYTADAPLFGRYTGRYYVPSHARGTAKNGIVDKDYVVKTTECCVRESH